MPRLRRMYRDLSIPAEGCVLALAGRLWWDASRAGEARAMNQVALPEREPDPDATPVIGMRARLLALAILCVAGSLALTGGLALHRALLEQRSIEDGALTLARGIVNAADRETAASIARMEALVTSPALRTGDLETFHRQLAATPLPDGTWFVLWDRERQLLNTLRPFGAPLPRLADFNAGSQEAI